MIERLLNHFGLFTNEQLWAMRADGWMLGFKDCRRSMEIDLMGGNHSGKEVEREFPNGSYIVKDGKLYHLDV